MTVGPTLLTNLQQKPTCALCMDVLYVVKDVMVQRLVLGRLQQCFHLSGLMGILSAWWMFSAYMEEVLLPTLTDGDIVIMDNLSAHKNSFDIDKFKTRNIDIKYLPAYSQDLNPIEKMWSKIKAKLREYQATDTYTLFFAIKDAFSLVTASNAIGWFQSCGYFQ